MAFDSLTEKLLECQEKILDTNENLLYDSTGDK